jgi:uncharacterized protein YxjI
MKGKLVAEIKQTSFLFGNKFDIYSNGEYVASMQKYLSFQPDAYYVRKLHWLVTGRIDLHDYKIYHGTKKIMSMSEDENSEVPLLRINIEQSKNEPTAICIACVLDYFIDRDEKSTIKLFKKKYTPVFN